MTDNKIQNERKLIKNIDNIIKNYLKVDDKLLESIASEDDTAFKEQLAKHSEDGFLNDVVDNYQEFVSRMKDRLKDIHGQEIQDIHQKKLKEYGQTQAKTKKRTITVTTTAKKGQRQKWTPQEKKILRRSKKAGNKPKKTAQKINTYRRKQGLPERTNKSISNKYYKEK